MPSVSLSPGRITACWYLLRCLRRLGDSAQRSDLLALAARSSLRSGGLPIRDGLRLAIEGKLLTVSGDQLTLTAASGDLLELGTEDEPTDDARRVLISRLLLDDPPNWVIYWQGDPDSLDLVLPATERRSISEAGLMPPSDASGNLMSWAFWLALRRVPLMSQTAAHRKALGDAGEALSMSYERQRLEREGHPELANRVRWLARESDAYGFDILSFIGGAGPRPGDHLAVEVKATSLPRGRKFRFFLSAHEWEVAQAIPDQYVLHLWTRVDPGPPALSRDPGPTVINQSSLLPHLPEAGVCGGECAWESTKVVLPM
jgi:hypothetical protein